MSLKYLDFKDNLGNFQAFTLEGWGKKAGKLLILVFIRKPLLEIHFTGTNRINVVVLELGIKNGVGSPCSVPNNVALQNNT